MKRGSASERYVSSRNVLSYKICMILSLSWGHLAIHVLSNAQAPIPSYTLYRMQVMQCLINSNSTLHQLRIDSNLPNDIVFIRSSSFRHLRSAHHRSKSLPSPLKPSVELLNMWHILQSTMESQVLHSGPFASTNFQMRPSTAAVMAVAAMSFKGKRLLI